MEEYVKETLEIVKAQAGFRVMNEDEISSMIQLLAASIRQFFPDAVAPAVLPNAGSRYVLERSVTCLECGKRFKLLTRRHLLSHELSPEEYRGKWGYPKDFPLVCKALQRERRKKMRALKLWEKRRKHPAQKD